MRTGLFDLVEAGGKCRCWFIPIDTGHDGLVTEHNRVAVCISSAAVVAIVISGAEISHDKIGALMRTHAASGCRRGKYLGVDFYGAVFVGDMSATVSSQLFRIDIAAVIVGRMVGEKGLKTGWITLGKIHYALPDSGRSSWIVIGVGDVVKGQCIGNDSEA